MKLTEIKTNACIDSINYELEQAFWSGWLTAKFETSIEQLEKYSTRFNYNGITVRPTTREAALKALQAFGGKWDKSVEEYYPDKIKYVQAIPNPFGAELAITISQVPPPPSCRIEEVEELVPASVRKVRKMVCPKPEATVEDELVEEQAPVPTLEQIVQAEAVLSAVEPEATSNN